MRISGRRLAYPKILVESSWIAIICIILLLLTTSKVLADTVWYPQLYLLGGAHTTWFYLGDSTQGLFYLGYGIYTPPASIASGLATNVVAVFGVFGIIVLLLILVYFILGAKAGLSLDSISPAAIIAAIIIGIIVLTGFGLLASIAIGIH